MSRNRCGVTGSCVTAPGWPSASSIAAATGGIGAAFAGAFYAK